MNRLALVTGGTRGIGSAISKAFKKNGYEVVVSYAHNDNAAESFTKETGIKVYKWDVSSLKQCEKGIENIANDLKHYPNILVNNAGITKSLSRETASKGITVNSIAPSYMKTEMTDAVPRDVMEAIITQIPVRRLGRPDDDRLQKTLSKNNSNQGENDAA